MFGILYTVAFIIAMFMLALLLLKYKNQVSNYYILLFCAIAAVDLGYMQMASSVDTLAAIIANQTVYFGSCFTPFFLLMCVADLCKVKVKSIFQYLFIAYASFVFLLVSTIGKWDLYYTSVSLSQEFGVSFLVKEHGPLHILYPLYLAFCSILGLGMIIHAMRNRKDVSYKTSLILLSCMVIVVGVYAAEKMMHLHVELLPFAYLVAQTECIILLRRIRLYEVAAISAQSMLDNYDYGFVLVNNAGKYLGSDETAKEWFPEMKELLIDSGISGKETPLLAQINKWIAGEDENHIVYLEMGERVIEVTHSVLKVRGKKTVYCICLEDETEQQNYTKLMQQYNENLEKDVELKTKKLRRVQNDIIISMASIVENRDSNTGGHIARTSDIIRIFVDYLRKAYHFPELTEEMAHSIIKAAPLHDFGKIGIPDNILNKPGKFTDEEYEIMKQHSAKGAVIVEKILRHSEDAYFRRVAINVAHYHHEKWDGNGYPEKLSGAQIPFEARVMALADVFDALVSKRVYKDSFSYDKAFSIIEESKGTHFDPALCEAFLQCRHKLEELYNGYED